MKILANRMDLGFQQHQAEYEAKALEVLRSGWYVLGKEVTSFEENFASWIGASYCAGVGNGLDALWIGCRVLGIGAGDEVIVQGNTYIASVMGITINGATPVFVEPDAFYQIDASRIEEKITEKTKAIMVVHLYGQVADMDRITEICRRHHLLLVEDCAQAHGAMWKGRKVGTFGNIGCFSFYPTKNLGAFGDAGAVVSNDAETIEKIKVFRNYGSEKHYYNKLVGANSRLDEIQAGLLNVRLRYMEEITAERRKLAAGYDRGICNPKVILPKERRDTYAVYHQYVIRAKERDRLIRYLQEQEIGTIIHYPIPPHLSEAYASLGYGRGSFPITEEYADTVLSIPMYNGMTQEEQQKVITAINAF